MTELDELSEKISLDSADSDEKIDPKDLPWVKIFFIGMHNPSLNTIHLDVFVTKRVNIILFYRVFHWQVNVLFHNKGMHSEGIIFCLYPKRPNMDCSIVANVEAYSNNAIPDCDVKENFWIEELVSDWLIPQSKVRKWKKKKKIQWVNIRGCISI